MNCGKYYNDATFVHEHNVCCCIYYYTNATNWKIFVIRHSLRTFEITAF